MSTTFGPVLSFRGIEEGLYWVSALWVQPLALPAPPHQVPAGVQATLVEIASIPLNAPTQKVWRLDMRIAQTRARQIIDYRLGDGAGSFQVPEKGQSPRIAYASCSGVSSYKHIGQLGARYGERWAHMAKAHQQAAYHLLVMGGDQVYSDALLEGPGPLHEWSKQFSWNRHKNAWSPAMDQQADAFFASVYQEYWARPEILHMLSHVPTLMMWDDHDIIDGWGSYPQALHESPVHQNLLRIATAYFRIFQQQLRADERRPGALTPDGFTFGFANLGKLALLVPDLRSERRPDITTRNGNLKSPTQVMSQTTHRHLQQWLANLGKDAHAHLLCVSSIPVAFVNLALLETLVEWIPGEIGPEDDFRDHWRHQPHRNERKQLLYGLLDFAEAKNCKVTLVSGDVHLAAASVIRSTSPKYGNRGAESIHQLISTGIVHPPLAALMVRTLETITSTTEKIDTDLTAEMQAIGYDGRCLVARRNWLSLEPDGKDEPRRRLWVKWHVEDQVHPITRVIEPVR
ncbi:alkaline phosphatase D family protein [Pseudomonas entomophila]|uniref:alkaline phosphatase D family protein n=1 Tax=Pseudomonas entomophila TaxID=312306 RepID=UPI0023D7F47F|nr:alkaline phosphatase D family protein [Pseudomonas entomophila]MDF0729314.1 alkaline phosphatase D family protein [Pseudomonas entomophila]